MSITVAEDQTAQAETLAVEPVPAQLGIAGPAIYVVPPLPELKQPLPHNKLSPISQSNLSWSLVAHGDTYPEQYHLNPKVFRDIASQFTLFDKVQMLASDGSWWADFLVVEMGADAASLHLLQSVYLDTGNEDREVIPGFLIRRSQPGDNQVGWIIVNRETGKTVNLNTQIVSYDAAVHFLTHSGQAHPKHRSSGLVG